MSLQLFQRLIRGCSAQRSVLPETAEALHSDPVTVPQDAWQDTPRWPGTDTHPVRLRQAPANGWDHGRAPQPAQGKGSVRLGEAH